MSNKPIRIVKPYLRSIPSIPENFLTFETNEILDIYSNLQNKRQYARENTHLISYLDYIQNLILEEFTNRLNTHF